MPFLATLLVAFQIMQSPSMPIFEESSTDPPPVGSLTYNAAVRFLEQATFGPTPKDISHLLDTGLDR